jgi:flagellar protein FlaI
MTKINFNPRIPIIPNLEDKTKIDVRYMLIVPYVSAHVHWDTQRGELVYEVEEPALSDTEKAFLAKISASIQDMINISLVVQNQGLNSEEYLDKIIRLIISELNLNIVQESYDKIFYYVYRDFMGLNEIEALMHDYFIEDIECNGAGDSLYIVHRIFRNLRTNVTFPDVEKLASFVEKIAQKTGRYVSYASPLLDGTLPDGSRVNATYTKDVTSKGPTFTIRKFTKTPWTPIQLLGFGTLSPEMLAYFWLMMEYKMNVLIAGGTASGKTTLLNAIAFFIPPKARVVSIEDTRELNLPRENWLPAVARTGVGGTQGGIGDVDMFSLLKSSFRQNPDYVIVGEVRGEEANVLFQGMASGHASMGTIHADSVDTVVRRLETPPISLNPTLVNELDVVAVMTHAIVKGKETRKLREVIEVINVNADGTSTTNTPFMWNPGQDRFYFKKGSKVFEKIEKRSGISQADLEIEFAKRVKLLYTLYQKKIFSFEELKRLVQDYYANPAAILAKYGVV